MTEAADLGVRGAIDALTSGKATAVQLAKACLSRIRSERGRAINAFIHVAEAFALEQARASDQRRAARQLRSQLDGVPIAVKDNIDVEGLPTTNGLATHWMPDADAPVIRRLREAGMTMLGKLNMHEGALGATTDNRHHGRCIHPDFPGYTPGGSSGGSAAAVAGGLCPVTLGTDTMGSVRLPAAYCGIVGFKPSRDYWSAAGVMPLAFGLDTIGPLARSVGDIATLLDEDLSERVTGTIRLGHLCSAGEVAVDPHCQDALDVALAHLAKRGAAIAPADLPGFEPGRARRSGFIVSEVDAAAAHERLLAEMPEAFSPEFLAMLTYGQSVSPERYRLERDATENAGELFLNALDPFDAIVTLTAPQCAFSFDQPAPVNQADLTAIANFSGCPAISLPIPLAPGALPVGLQLISAPGTDRALLEIASQVETQLKGI